MAERTNTESYAKGNKLHFACLLKVVVHAEKVTYSDPSPDPPILTYRLHSRSSRYKTELLRVSSLHKYSRVVVSILLRRLAAGYRD